MSRVRDAVMAALGIASIALVYVIEGTADPSRREVLLWVDLALVVVFITEWAWQASQEERRGRWAVRNAWKLLGMIPLIVVDAAALRFLRLVRVARVITEIPWARKRVRRIRLLAKRSQIGKLGLVSGGITLVGSTLVWLAERDVNPHLASWGEAIWWGVVTVTTVGYGDITPITQLGRGVAVALMVTGIGTIGLLASQVSQALIRPKERFDAQAALARLHREGVLDDQAFLEAKRNLDGPRPVPADAPPGPQEPSE